MCCVLVGESFPADVFVNRKSMQHIVPLVILNMCLLCVSVYIKLSVMCWLYTGAMSSCTMIYMINWAHGCVSLISISFGMWLCIV